MFLLTVETNKFLNSFFLFQYFWTDVGGIRFIMHSENHQCFLDYVRLIYFKNRVLTSPKTILKIGKTSQLSTAQGLKTAAQILDINETNS